MKKNQTIRKLKKTSSPMYGIICTVLLVYSLMMALLLAWGISTSLKHLLDFRTNKVGLPNMEFGLAWENFEIVFEKFETIVMSGGRQQYVNFWGMLNNTLLYAGVGALISSIVPCLVAYVCAKTDFKFNGVIYGIVIVSMVLPIVGSAPSEMKMLKDLGIYNTMYGNWIQKFHFLGMYFLVYYAAFKSFPNTYLDAAYIDGAGEWRTLLHVTLPLVRNTFLTILLIRFIDYWNDYQTPLLYIPSHPTLAVGLFNLGNSTVGELSWVPRKVAACIILLLPIMTLFITFRDKLMGSLTMGGIKG
ncbi:MAG: carbohydrate ABC transporter permease [Oscillospiraceae bacterium]|nr:carbohydrate ABC transporter permease [Oscillospiraceae bacterium]